MPTPDSKPLKVIILGCGRVGSTLARQLSLDGHSVTIIDLTNDAFRRLGPKFQGHRIVGTGLDTDTLRKAGIAEANVFIAVTQGDNTNIMAAQIAKDVFSIPKVIARIYDPIRAQAYRELGITTLCTTTLASAMIRSAAVGGGQNDSWQEMLENWDKSYLEMIG
jgi:trk system potassium uptake protein